MANAVQDPGVYDPETDGERSRSHPDLGPGHNQPSNNPSDPRGHDAAANDPSDPRGDGLQQAESSAGGSGGTQSASGRPVDSDGLRDREESASDNDDDQVGKGYTYGNSNSTGKRKVRFKITKQKAGVGIGTTIIISITFGFFSISSGPLQLVHLSEILQKDQSSSNEAGKIRLSRLYRLARTGNYGETRVGILGSRIVNKTLDQLKEVGVEFQRDRLDHITGAKIDPKKLAKNFPEMQGMSEAEKKSFIADKLGLSEDQVIKRGTSYEVKGLGSIRASRLLLKNSVALLENGDLVTAIKFRSLSKFFNTPTLFHPIEKAKAALGKLFTTKVAAAEEENRLKTVEEPTTQAALAPEGDLKGKLTKQDLVGKALLFTAGMCLVRDVAGDVVKVNRAAIVIPVVIQATDKIAVGEQVKQGDITASQAGGVVQSFTDGNGKSIWQGKALQATAGLPQTGEDLGHDYQQAFAGGTTAQGINSYLGGGGFGSVVCSGPGKLVQAVAGVGLLISGFFDAGVSWGAKAAQAGDQAVNATATAGAIYVIQQQFVKLLSDKAIVPTVLKGAVGGNLLAYGAREASNIGARASGGIPLTNQQTAELDKQQQLEDQQGFRSKGYFARVFDANDYRSLAGRLADSLSPSLSQNVATIANSFMNIGNILPHIFSSLIPKAHAADNPYDWGFPKYGIPLDVLNDPNMQDPYDNANKVAALLDAGDTNNYIGKAKTCFGVDISKGANGWDAIPAAAVNPNDDGFVNAHCGDTSDSNWKRVILFVFDTNTMKADACYQGDAQSCSDVGYDSGSSSSSSSPSSNPPSPAGSTTFGLVNPLSKVSGLQPSRIDQGVDYGGSGPILAIGAGKVLSTTNAGWLGGTFIVIKLDALSDKYAYVAENCQNIKVHSGQHVKAGDELCTLVNAPPNLEMGWANGSSIGDPISRTDPSVDWKNHDSTDFYTAYGENFSQLLVKLNAPAGTIKQGAQKLGSLPGGWPTW